MTAVNKDNTALQILSFKSAVLFNKWLRSQHAKSSGIWLRIFRKNSGEKTVTYQEALEEALCYGWIDGQRKSYDEKSFLQRFTPRRKKSVWSQRNISFVKNLIKQRRMKPSGLMAVNEAKADGRWKQAYASQKTMVLPKDFLSAVRKNKKAFKTFQTLNKSKLFSIYWKLHTSKKPETRLKRLKLIIEDLAAD